jgi:hypothetical protein
VYYILFPNTLYNSNCKCIPKPSHILHDIFLRDPHKPNGLLAVPFLVELPVTPGRLAILAAAPTPLVDNPSGFDFVVARLPAAPVMSLSELPYSRTISPQLRDVFAIL